MNIRQIAVLLGGGISALVLPTIAVHTGFAAICGALAATYVLAAVLAQLRVYDVPGMVNVVAQAAPSGGTGPLRDPTLLRVVLAIGLLCVSQGAVVAFVTVFLRGFVHANVFTPSLTMATVQGGAAIMRAWSGRWIGRHDDHHTYLLVCVRLSVALFVGLVSVAWTTSTLPINLSVVRVALAAAVVVGGTCVSAWRSAGYTELTTLAGAQRTDTALGLSNAGAFTTLGLTSLCLPQVLVWSSWPVVWLVATASALIAWHVLPAVRQ